MSIQFSCPGCSKRLRVPEERRGKKIRCPACMTVTVVSDPQEESPPPIAKTPPSAQTLPAVKTAPSAQEASSAFSSTAANAMADQDPFRVLDQEDVTSVENTFDQESPFVDDSDTNEGGHDAFQTDELGEVPWSNLPSTETESVGIPTMAPPTASAIPTASLDADTNQSPNETKAGASRTGSSSPGKTLVTLVEDVESKTQEVDKLQLTMVMLIVLGPLVAFFAYRGKARYDRLVNRGVTVDGIVVDSWMWRGKKYRREYYLEVEFITKDGLECSDGFPVDRSFYEDSEIGQTVSIAYDASRPYDAVIVGGKHHPMLSLFVGMSLTVVGVLGAVLIISRKALLQRPVGS